MAALHWQSSYGAGWAIVNRCCGFPFGGANVGKLVENQAFLGDYLAVKPY
jgi:hypothetical protein